MTAPWATCARCDAELYPRLARRTNEGWVCADAWCARREDIRYMAATGESATGAAARLGISFGGLEKFCLRHGLRDELRVMRARDPRDHNVQAGVEAASRARWAA